jgi:enoyl-CoA hydratase/carnithine racemase
LFTDLATAIREDDESMTMMTRSEDFKEGVRAFIEKRPAKYQGR